MYFKMKPKMYETRVTDDKGANVAGTVIKRKEAESYNALRKGQVTRRGFLAAGLAAVVGTGVGYGAHVAGDSVIDGYEALGLGTERTLRATGYELKKVYGALNHKIEAEVEEFREKYSAGKLQIYEDLEIARKGELEDLARVIETCNEIQKDYDFASRAGEIWTRLDGMILKTEEGLEGMRKYEPSWFEKIENSVRSGLGHPVKEKGKEYRPGMKRKVESLNRILDMGGDNLTMQGILLGKINEYADRTPGVSDEERALFGCLRDEAERGGIDNVRSFIKNYDGFDAQTHVYIKLRSNLMQAEQIYSQIQDDKKTLETLHGLAARGSDLEAKIKERDEKTLAEGNSQIKEEVDRLVSHLGDVNNYLKGKGYDFETKEEAISKGTFGGLARGAVDAFSVSAGVLSATGTWFLGRRGAETAVAKATARDAVVRHNELARRFNELAGEYEANLEVQENARILAKEKAKRELDGEYIDGAGI